MIVAGPLTVGHDGGGCMFYMGGMTLGYLSPIPRQADEGEADKRDPAPAETRIRIRLLDLLKPAVPQKARQEHTAWPIHVFY
ncbi:hypothetical protein J2Y48_001120 [Mycoplana sp. BE70]|uniref:hypothetical protein n=1 Tax=Mycoplana sp. BE70 TaxID=2817775 RepID=UPI00285B6FCA|nr:hypothetical protein [Mycoplana sp. BE70]MDR6755835.1 hypothetical protein [Mycoplana sp. BE70]